MTIDEIIDEIKQANTIVVLTHETPDGDAIGSSLGVKLALEKIGKTVDVIITECPRMYDYLPKFTEIKKKSDIEKYDLAISVDCADLKRLDKKEYFENALKTIVIDHHGSNNMYGDLNYVNPAAPACSEIILAILTYFKFDIDIDIGTCLMTGIITDTGGLQYPATTADTFEYTAELLRKGVNISEIYKRTLHTKTRANFELGKRVIERLELLENGKIAFSYITLKDLNDVNAEEGDHEGLVNIGREIENVQISIFIRQKNEQDEYKISMRSNSDKINVSDICMIFGGGGHPRAAGAVIKGDVQTIKEKLLSVINKMI